MININTYVLRYGNRSFEKYAFNDVDGLVLAELSMINFETVLGDKEIVALKDIVFADYKKAIYGSPDARANGIMLKRMMNSERYKDIQVGYVKRAFSEDAIANQFYAVTFILPDGTIYISFRGTDITLIGWKEDLYLTFMDKILAHDQAAEYTEEILRKVPGQLILGGHSKGGNLALYAGLNVNERFVNRVTTIYSYDGPGFREGIEQYPNYPIVKDKIKKFITHRDLVGMIFKDVPKFKIVYSNGALLGGHDPFTWRINNNSGHFILKKKCSNRSQIYALTINTWVNKMSIEDRKLGTDALFTIVGKAKNIYDLLKYLGPNIANYNSVIKKYPKEERMRLKELIALFFDSLKTSRKTVNSRKKKKA